MASETCVESPHSGPYIAAVLLAFFVITLDNAMDFVDMYNKNNELAWYALLHLEFIDHSDDLRQESYDFAKKFLGNVMQGLLVIESELNVLGYQFLNPDSVLIPAKEDALEQLDKFEDANGTLPVILKAWYSVFHSVDFRQSREQVEGGPGHETSPVAGLGFYCPLFYLPFTECVDEICDSFRPHCNGAYFLPTGDFGTNCDPKGMNFPSRSFDETFFNDGGGDVLFGEHIKFILHCGGFPYWWIMYQMEMMQDSPLHGTPNIELYWSRVMPKMPNLGLIV